MQLAWIWLGVINRCISYSEVHALQVLQSLLSLQLRTGERKQKPLFRMLRFGGFFGIHLLL